MSNTPAYQTNMFLAMREVGDRVELVPHIAAYMDGDTVGTVEAVGKYYLHVRMEISGRTIRVVPENVKEASA